MAALCEGYTLCGLVPAQNRLCSGLRGIEEERDSDHVIVTESTRCATLYKVSDQKPLSSWTVKQGQSLTSSAVFNTKTSEYVAVSDNKVIRIWKEEDILLDKAFKATVSADVWMVHCPRGGEPVVLFQRGDVRLLDSLLAAPHQPVQEVLAQEESIRWSTSIVTEMQQMVIFTTELKGDHFLCLQRLNPNSLQRYHLEREEPGLSPLSFSTSYRDKHICLLYLYPNGHVYESLISVRGSGAGEGSEALSLPRSLILSLPVGDDLLEAAAAVVLDDAHVAVVGVPHPCAGPGKDFLCIWNTNFQTLQAGKEMAGKLYGQLWSYSNKLFIPHGKTLSVIPFACPKSCLASALGKLKQARAEDSRPPALVPSWNNILHGEKHQPPKTAEIRKTVSWITDEDMCLLQTASAEEVKKEVEGLLTRQDVQDLQLSLGQLAVTLVSRSLAEPAFYTPSTLQQLVHTQCLCHSICPDLVALALEKKDYFLCQLCLQFFPDIPEVITCACLKAFISLPDADAERLSLEPDGVSFMQILISREHDQVGLQNGFTSTSCEDEDAGSGQQRRRKDEENARNPPEPVCPVGVHKAALINEVLQAAYSDTFLLPHLKDLSSQHVILFLQYLQFLYQQYSLEAFPQKHSFRSPSQNQVSWIGFACCWMLKAYCRTFTDLLIESSSCVQVKLFLQLGKIESSLQQINEMKVKEDVGAYSIEVIELF
uniref:Nucleolar protein 11 n=1 Tax=Nothobranchius furzeri TaxID=105023 RepID=A0A8C6NL26_NOTFU